MSKHFGTWLKAQSKISDLKNRQYAALYALQSEKYQLVLHRGRMWPTSVIITDVSMADRVQVMRLDTGARRWVHMSYLSDAVVLDKRGRKRR